MSVRKHGPSWQVRLPREKAKGGFPTKPAAIVLIFAVAAVIFVLLLAAERGGSAPGARFPTWAAKPSPAGARCPDARRGLAWYQAYQARWRWRTGMGRPPRPKTASSSVSGFMPCATVRQAAQLWRARAIGARRQYVRWFRTTYAKWECVHSLEGPWNDPDAPYYGGLQMDWDFQRAYGMAYLLRWGHAGRWPVWAQLVAAERAYESRGWSPWPNTSIRCGLA